MESLFRVGPWLVQPTLNSVSRGGTSIHVTPKVMEVLVCLAEHAGEPVSKEKLLQVIWPDTFVSEDVLKGSISELRRVFEDDAKEPRIIQTIAKRGYRLIAPIEPVNENARESQSLPNPAAHRTAAMGKSKSWTRALFISGAALVFVLLGAFDRGGLWKRLAGQSGATQIHSLAVLPLQNLSGDPAQEYFSDGMTDALITDLAKIGSVKVISRTSSMQYKQTKKSLPEIARELNVDGIIEGTVQRSGDRVRITAQLLYGPSDKHLWANSYERDLHDVFALERDLTEEIARQVRARLTMPYHASMAPPRPVNPQALDAYLQGKYHLSRFARGGGDEAKKKAAEYFQRAIEADPDFAHAYSGLATTHLNLLWPSRQDAEIATKAAERAVALDPNSSDAHKILGDIKLATWNWLGAEEEFRQAVALSPNSADAHGGLGILLDMMGRLDEGWKEEQFAQELDPNNADLFTSSVLCGLELRGDYDRAITISQTFLKVYPDNGYLHLDLADNYLKKGMYDDAMPHIEQFWTLFGRPDVSVEVHRAFVTSGYRGAIQASAKATEHLMARHQVLAPVNLAELYATLGDKERAFYWLEQAYAQHDISIAGAALGLEWLNMEPLLEPLRSDPRYKDLVRRVGLPQMAASNSAKTSQQTDLSKD